MKKNLFVALILLVALFSFTSCKNNNSDGVVYVKTETGESIPVLNIEQTAEKKEDFLDTEVSWYNGDYNYWVFEIGKIKNVPLTPTYAVFAYDGAEFTYSNEVVKTTIESMETATSSAVTKFIKLGATAGTNKTKGIAANLGQVVSANVERGFSISTTGETSKQSTWSETYKSTQSYSESYKTNITLTFNNSCKTGNYLFLYLGNITVYCAVVQSRTTGDYFIQTYNKIDSYKHVLKYAGEDDEFPINEKTVIDFDTSFVENLTTPTTHLEGLDSGVAYPVVKQTAYRQESMTVKPLNTQYVWMGIDDYDNHFSAGYNKVRITFKYYTTGGWSLFGGNVNIQTFVSPDNNENNRVYDAEPTSNKDGKWIEDSFVTDLKWFKDTKEVHFIFDNNNVTEEFTISNLTIDLEIYHEE